VLTCSPAIPLRLFFNASLAGSQQAERNLVHAEAGHARPQVVSQYGGAVVLLLAASCRAAGCSRVEPSASLALEHGGTVVVSPGTQDQPRMLSQVFQFDLPLPRAALGALIGERARCASCMPAAARPIRLRVQLPHR
jgi:hypothetical protein